MSPANQFSLLIFMSPANKFSLLIYVLLANQFSLPNSMSLANQFSLPNSMSPANQFLLSILCHQRTSFWCRCSVTDFHIRIDLNAWNEFIVWLCNMCGTLECEHVDSWNMYGDESCDFKMQMCWFVTIDVLGGVTEIGPSTGQGHPTGGTSRWFPPFFCIM